MVKKIKIISILLMLLITNPAFAFYLWWPNTGSSSYKVYELVQRNPVTFEFVEEVFENRFNLDGRINDIDWTYFAVSSCCGSDCSPIHNVIGVKDTDQSGNPNIRAAHYQYEIELEIPIMP